MLMTNVLLIGIATMVNATWAIGIATDQPSREVAMLTLLRDYYNC